MHILKPFEEDYNKICELYETMYSRNAIAFLGAGASVTDKKVLSKNIIEEFEALHSLNFETDDIIKFVDILEQTRNLSRNSFDKFVVDRIENLRPTEAHRQFISIPWQKIITTNFDTIVEDAFIEIKASKATPYKIKTVRNKQQLDGTTADNEIKYIKLNGCKTDLGEYKLVFSSDDFAKRKTYYEKVLKPIKQLSPEIKLITFGYSFTDPFAEKLLDFMENTTYRDKKPLYCVDPYLNENKLDYLLSKQIIAVRCSFKEFIEGYVSWFEKNNKSIVNNLQQFTNTDESKISLDISSRILLNNNIIQLKDDYHRGNRLNKRDFYYGSEPNFQVIVNGFDVVRKKSVEDFISKIKKSFEENVDSNIPNLLLVDGDFGTGKTTFVYRGIKAYLNLNKNTLAFEIVKPLDIKDGSLIELIDKSNVEKFIFYCDHIENDSTYKSFNQLRVDLAKAQYSNRKILFISSIRENILSRYVSQNKYNIKNLINYHYNPKYNQTETEELVDNLKEVGIVNYRDISEKQSIVNEMLTKYNGDSFITLLQTVKDGKHIEILENAYEELSSEMKEAFKITSLIHRFGMSCPIELVKNAISSFNWDVFIENVMKGNGKGILFQQKNIGKPDQPDLFFITKHPVIADALIKKLFTNSKKYNAYKNIFQNISFSDYNSIFLVDLIKNISSTDNDITLGQKEQLYELAKKEFKISIHFMLSYVTNIEKTHNSIERLKDCLIELEDLENESEKRNHRIIHRKGCINFRIAVLLKRNNDELKQVNKYLSIAEDWFDIKKHLDPVSDYSYVEYLKMLKWEICNMPINQERKLQILTTTQNLYDEAKRIVVLNFNKIKEIYDEFASDNLITKDDDYKDFLLESYQKPELRTKSAILLYYYFESINDFVKAEEFAKELKSYTDDKDVVNFLFKYYGRNLHIADNRIRFFELTRFNDFLEKKSPLRFSYFSYVAEYYNYSFKHGKSILYEISKISQAKFNPDFYLYWKTPNNTKEVFNAEFIEDKKIFKVWVNKLHKAVPLIKGNYEDYEIGQNIDVTIRFMFDGLQAEIKD